MKSSCNSDLTMEIHKVYFTAKLRNLCIVRFLFMFIMETKPGCEADDAILFMFLPIPDSLCYGQVKSPCYQEFEENRL